MFTPGMFTPGLFTPGMFTPGVFTPGVFMPATATPERGRVLMVATREAIRRHAPSRPLVCHLPDDSLLA